MYWNCCNLRHESWGMWIFLIDSIIKEYVKHYFTYISLITILNYIYRPLLVSIWAKILAVDSSCQTDLIRDSSHKYFLSVLQDDCMMPNHRTWAAFILASIVNNYKQGMLSKHATTWKLSIFETYTSKISIVMIMNMKYVSYNRTTRSRTGKPHRNCPRTFRWWRTSTTTMACYSTWASLGFLWTSEMERSP